MNLQSYADLGWSVFPVKGPAYGKDYKDTKASLVEWKPYQTRKPTAEEISNWLRKFPKASVAVATGPINGIFVVDIDSEEWTKHFPNADFGTTWKSLSKRGCHYFYKWQDWMRNIKTTGSEVGDIDGFDIRGEGGYAIVPNDNDPDRKWSYSPLDGPEEELPDFLRQFFEKEVSRMEKKPFTLSAISEHNRHTPYISLIGKLIRAKMNPAEIIQVVTPMVEKTGLGEDPEKLVMDLVLRYPVERREKLRPESMEALLSEDEPPLSWMIEGLWTDRARGFIAGHPGTGKTWIALEMLLAVATGGGCMGKYKASYAAPCLIVEEEASRHNLQRRIHALARARGLAPADLKNVFHITRQMVQMPAHKDEIIEIVRDKGIKFVVFDSLREVHGAKENSSDDMVPILKAFGELSNVGDCSVLLIHHLSKTNDANAGKPIFERMRGTGSLWAWRDCILGIEGEEDSDTCSCSFQFRDAESPKPVQIKRFVSALTGAIGLEAVSLEDSLEFMEQSEEITAFVKSQIAGASGNRIVKGVGGNRGEILNHIKRMLKAGKLVKSGSIYVVPE